ncbi:hypothetical protein HJFPF1_09224 [Paramyrothecium foliicola]|nr:hypothetical protein HJFPF1_09224 [Paramyrothecium foliicola]
MAMHLTAPLGPGAETIVAPTLPIETGSRAARQTTHIDVMAWQNPRALLAQRRQAGSMLPTSATVLRTVLAGRVISVLHEAKSSFHK